MKNILRLLFVTLLIVGVANPGMAEMFKGDRGNKGNRNLKQTTAGCTPSSAFEWLNINNVRTRINAGGDMWWDLPGGTGSKYYIPANGSATSLYAGSLWIAGTDINNQLKCAAVRFRQDGNDFWTGPLNLEGASIDEVTCARWDQIWKITRAEVDEFLNHCDPVSGVFKDSGDGYTIPKSITDWPAHPDVVGGNISGVSHYIAPFFDRDGNGEYDPLMGDYPYYDINNELCHTKIPTMEEEFNGTVWGSILADQVLKGDQTLWWIFNDKGNSHTESNGSAIGLEIRGQAFAFSTNDEINNMSFCSYEIINRSTYELTNTFFCPWTDVDLGYAKDDFVGCDVQRGLGFGYNGAAIDGGGEPEAYGNQPPAVGVDFFQGPYIDADGIDNPKYKYVISSSYQISESGDSTLVYDTISQEQICDASINGVNFGNGIVDDERFGMRRFLYHNNSNGALGDPDNAAETYLLLQSYWRDGNKMQFGGTGYPTGGNAAVGPECDFMFPGDTDPCNWGTHGIQPNGGYNVNGKYWTEENEGNPPEDRRFMQSAGPFTLKPGAVNYITFGVPWARASSGGPWASVELLRVTDDKCQALFDNCFKVIDGPNAPDLTIRELDQKLIIYLSNSAVSNNYREGYVEIDPKIPEFDPSDETKPADRMYRFEGYKVYQLASAEVGADELSDNSKARLVFQADIKNNVSTLVNYEWDNYIGGNVPSLKVSGADGGITHSFVITEDKFSTGESTALVNYKTYYYMAVAYAYNNYLTYSQEPGVMAGLYGQMTPYLEGRKNIQCYPAVPHKIVNGTVMVANYGDKPSITRLVGQGTGDNEIELTQECIDELFTKKLANTVVIKQGGQEVDHITYSTPVDADTVDKVVFGHPDYPIIYHPTYKVGYGPLDVKIIDPLNVKTTSYELWFDTLIEHYTHGVSSNQSVQGDSALRYASHWYLKDLETNDTMRCDTLTIYADEKMFIDRGISVSISQPFQIGAILVGSTHDSNGDKDSKEVVAPNNGMITSALIFQDSTQQWLDGIRDLDVSSSVLNWIRSGTYVDQDNTAYHDYDMTSSTGGISTAWDPQENYEKIANRTWAPYNLTSIHNLPEGNPGPLPKDIYRFDTMFSRLTSIDIVLTADRSKWTRCPVVEMCMDANLSQNGVDRFSLRRAPSIDKDGNPYTGEYWDYKLYGDSLIEVSDNPDDPNYIAAQGMGWFPGYVIDVESGARLNVLYGEDSYLEDMNGRDLMFNPPQLRKSTVDGTTDQTSDPALFRQVDLEPILGGKHFVYIWGMDRPSDIPQTAAFPYKDFNSPAYDGGKYLFKVLNAIQNAPTNNLVNQYQKRFWRQALWVGMPMGVEGTEWLPEGNDAKIRIRIAKPYARGYARIPLDSLYQELDINGQYPMFSFAIDGLDPILNDPAKTESDLDLIKVVPNPYYAYSSYEANALVNRVKITNLPKDCVVTIYNISGTKIRQFKKDNDEPSIDWDLTNFANTPVASGFYLIHVKDNTSGGERTVKFFGAMRQIDLNTF